MMVENRSSLTELRQRLTETPTMADVHPLLPLCMPHDTRFVHDSRWLLAQLDSREDRLETSILLLKPDKKLGGRIPHFHCRDHPPVEEINQGLHLHIDYARQTLLTTHKVAGYIADDVQQGHYDLVVTLFVDGLSYGDVLDWKWNTIPCFVDGPSVTFQPDNRDRVIPSIGFPSIINRPSIAERLHALGYFHALGFAYWHSESNQVSEYLFRGIPDHKVRNFTQLLHLLQNEQIGFPGYIQIVRDGLDGLAHGKRELSREEINASLQALYDDIVRLIDLLSAKSRNAIVYVTADHGVLWKEDHDWVILNQRKSSPRYAVKAVPEEIGLHHSTRFEQNNIPYYLFHYPYLGTKIHHNNSGVHGGLSYQESFVPFIRIEV